MINRFMRLLVFFDLPTARKEDRKNYARFRKELIRLGFDMVQFSVYCRTAKNSDDARAYTERVRKILPPVGSVRVLQLTEKQYSSMAVMLGEKNPSEYLLDGGEFLEL